MYRCSELVQAFSLSYDSAPRPPPPPVSSTSDTQEGWERETTCSRERGGWARSRIIRPQEGLVIYKSFKTLWLYRQTIQLICSTDTMAIQSTDRSVLRSLNKPWTELSIFSQSQYMDLIFRNVIYTLNTGRVPITIFPRKKNCRSCTTDCNMTPAQMIGSYFPLQDQY